MQNPFSMHICFPLDTEKPCFVLEMVTRADLQTVRISFCNMMLYFWVKKVIQILYILSEKSGQQSTLFEFLSKYFCIHYLYVVKDSKELIIIQLFTTPCNSM